MDIETNKVIGIISDHWTTSGNVDANLNFAIPVSSIVEKSEAAAILKEKNPGPSRVSWRDRIKSTIDSINEIHEKHGLNLNTHLDFNTDIINNINRIPIVGSILIVYL